MDKNKQEKAKLLPSATNLGHNNVAVIKPKEGDRGAPKKEVLPDKAVDKDKTSGPKLGHLSRREVKKLPSPIPQGPVIGKLPGDARIQPSESMTSSMAPSETQSVMSVVNVPLKKAEVGLKDDKKKLVLEKKDEVRKKDQVDKKKVEAEKKPEELKKDDDKKKEIKQKDVEEKKEIKVKEEGEKDEAGKKLAKKKEEVKKGEACIEESLNAKEEMAPKNKSPEPQKKVSKNKKKKRSRNQKENDNTVFEEVNAPVRPVTEKALEQIAEKRKKDNWLSKGETRKDAVSKRPKKHQGGSPKKKSDRENSPKLVPLNAPSAHALIADLPMAPEGTQEENE